MNRLVIFALSLMMGLQFAATPVFANTSAPAPLKKELTRPLTKKELKKQKRLKKKAAWLERVMTKKIDKAKEKEQKTGTKIFDSLDHYLRLTLIFFIAAVVFAVLASLMSSIAVLAEITAILAAGSAVASVIFFILWLAENV